MWTAEEYLAHHGILGMKWGQQNGPPYPLGSGDHSASEKKAGWRKSIGGGSGENLTKRQRRKLKKRYMKEAKEQIKEKLKEQDAKIEKPGDKAKTAAIAVGAGATAATLAAQGILLAERAKKGNDGRPTKDVKELNDDELKKVLSRKGMEEQYNKKFGGKTNLELGQEIANKGSKGMKDLSGEIDKVVQKRPGWQRMNLDGMSDQELRDAINRENLEIQYSKLFNKQPTITSGEKKVKQFLDVAGGVLATTATALGIAVAIKELKKKAATVAVEAVAS